VGASAISVLTDENSFRATTGIFRMLRANAALPVLRKDFIIDAIQVEQTVSDAG
jgi:indole-3-glycerol phosphate synthase